MRRTLLQIANNIAISTHLDEVTEVLSSDDRNTKLIYLCILRGIERDIWRAHSWASLRRFWKFTINSKKNSYQLPSDFGWYVNRTGWDITLQKPLLGPLDPYDWQKYTVADDELLGGQIAFTFGGVNDQWSAGDGSPGEPYATQVVVYPIPESSTSIIEGSTLTLAYISRNYIINSQSDPNSASQEFLTDSDIPILDADLVELAGEVRLRKSLGLAFADHSDELASAISDWRRKETGMKTIRADRPSSNFRVNVPQTGYGS